MSLRIVMRGQQLRIDHISTDRQTGRKGMIAPLHRHPVFHLMYIAGGAGRFVVNGRESEASEGLLYIINPNEWHQFVGSERRPLDNLECTFLLRNEDDEPEAANFFDWLEEKRGIAFPETIRNGPIRVPDRYRPFLLEGYRRLLDPASRYMMSDEHMSLMVADLLLRIEETVWQIGRADRHDHAGVRGGKEVDLLKGYMRAHLADALTLERLAQLVHWSPNYLCRVFKEHTGMAPMAYLQSLRMAEAEKLLLYTDLPVYAISDMLGYTDASYFARVFRRHRGRPPASYRIK